MAREEWRRLTDLMNDFNVTYVQLVPRVGLSAGRNALVDACQTKYLVLLDDGECCTRFAGVSGCLASLQPLAYLSRAPRTHTCMHSSR